MMTNAQQTPPGDKGITCIIAAISHQSRALGKNGRLLWHLPEDLKRFKKLTMGHPVIMGRKTWESLPLKFRPLPGRTNIVITRQSDYTAEGAALASNITAAFNKATHSPGGEEVLVIGGAEIYQQALPYTNRLYLTIVENEKDADAFFPAYDEFKEIFRSPSMSADGATYFFADFERKQD